jgi:hypothetical protein
MSVLGVRNLALNHESHCPAFRGILESNLEYTSIYLIKFTFCFWSIHADHLTVYTVPRWLYQQSFKYVSLSTKSKYETEYKVEVIFSADLSIIQDHSEWFH